MCIIGFPYCKVPRLGKAGPARLGIVVPLQSITGKGGGGGGAILLNTILIKEVIRA
jgi:hypothetical protein